uniref:Poly [ADP-ribose] polymerase n=1 Tax=Romanomermis culicivorax TaxID=13658 RepID=A0A915I2U6_ROMCU
DSLFIAQEQQIVSDCNQIYEKICHLSCEFYNLLPLKGFEHSKVVMIVDPTTLDEYVNLVNNLLEYEAGDRILKAASFNFESKNFTLHPYEYVFKALNCRMKLLDPKIWECQHILHYIYNTAPDCIINAVLKIFDEKKDEMFNPKNLANTKLLWHGTGVENLAGILTQGLMPAPFQASQSGQLFGKGIYTADTFDKSMNYCRRSSSKTMYMLLC